MVCNALRKIIAIAVSVLLLSIDLCYSEEAKPVDRFVGFFVGGLSGGHYSWENVDPPQYLSILREDPSRVIWAWHPPKGWVRKEHVEKLFSYVESTEPASAVCDVRSPHVPSKGFRSTVGQEAARLIERGYKEEFYPGSCSDLGRIDVTKLKEWWNQVIKKVNCPARPSAP